MVGDVLVLQSFTPAPWPAWRTACIQSVRSWARVQNYAYRMIGDELFDPIPAAARDGCHGVKLPLTDLGRLIWMRDLLSTGWSRVIWLDADILIFDDAFTVQGEGIGREVWLSRGLKSGFRAATSVNNCGLSFAAGSALLDHRLAMSLKAAAAFTAPPHPRALGPDLFRNLQDDHPAPVISGLAMASPLMVEALALGDLAPLAAHQLVWDGPSYAVNLCGSLATDDRMMMDAVRALERDPMVMAPDIPPPVVERVSFA